MTASSLAGLLAHIADHLDEPDHGPECQAVWRDPTDGELAACADDEEEPGCGYCTFHRDRSNGPRVLVWADRGDAVRVQHPEPATAKGAHV